MAGVTETAAGGVVFRKGQILLIEDAYGRVTFPKGIVEEGESPREAALREIEEETGIRGRIVDDLGSTFYTYEDDRGQVSKEARFFLVEAMSGSLAPQLEEIEGAWWESAGRVRETLADRGYEANLAVLDRALRWLREKGS